MKMIDAPTAPDSLNKVNLFGTLVVLFGVVGFLLWSIYTPLDSAVVAQGVVKVGSEKKQIQHLEGGIVEALLVNEGDYVSKGQTLLMLDETFAGTEHQLLSMEKQEMEIRQVMLTAQRDDLSSLLFPGHLTGLKAERALDRIESANKLFLLSKSALDNKLNIIEEQVQQLEKNAHGNKLELDAKREQLSYLKEEISSWQKLIDQKYANKLRYLEIQGEHAQLEGEIAQLQTEIVSASSRIEELKFEKQSVEKQFREAAASDLVEVQYRIKDLSKRIDSAGKVLGRIAIKAPVAGKVVGLNIYTLGAVIKSGETILEIVPEKDELVVGVKVRPIDIDKVNDNMRARIRISSYKAHEFPEFDGVVDSVSADAFQDPKTLDSYYTARITIPESSISMLPKDKIHPGMPADVMIVTGESSPAQYLMEPLLNAFRTAWRDS